MRRMNTPARQRFVWGLYAIPLVAGLVTTIRGAWVCDDAFISFRYVQQLLRGNGLVYNPGERVEGYTHFLWVLILAAGHRLGADLVWLGRYLPIAFQAALVAILFWRVAKRGRSPWDALPFAAWCVALHPDMQTFASGGLETAPFTLALTLSALAAAAPVVRPQLVGTLVAIASLLRPEGILYTAATLWYLLWRRSGWDTVKRVAGVWALLVVPLFLWRLFYYHDWLPNTFYAKSAAIAYWRQGWRYVSLYFEVYPILLLAWIATTVVAIRRERRGERGGLVFLCALYSSITLLYVLHLGGDFMFARFLLPVTPLLYVGLEEALCNQRRLVRVATGLAAVVLTVGARLPHEAIFHGTALVDGIVNERACYPDSMMRARRDQGVRIGAMVRGIDARYAIPGGQASLAYFADFPYVVERNGLTDREIAHRPITHRGRPGHEKFVWEPDLRNRRVDFLFRVRGDSLPGAINQIWFGDMVAVVMGYDPVIMDALRGRPGVRFIDFPAYFDGALERIHEVPLESLPATWTFFQNYYFSHTDDPERLARGRAAFASLGVDTNAAPGDAP